jgi:hypothetical protein
MPEIKENGESNRQYALDAIRYIKESIESINKLGDNLKPGYLDKHTALKNAREKSNLLQAKLGLAPKEVSLEYITSYVSLIEKIKIGNCGEQTYVAYKYLTDRGVKGLDIVEMKNGNHHFLVIGRDINSSGYDEQRISTWGKHAYVCDLLKEDCYSVVEFNQKQNEEEKLKIPNRYRFLRGDPEIVKFSVVDNKNHPFFANTGTTPKNQPNENRIRARL